MKDIKCCECLDRERGTCNFLNVPVGTKPDHEGKGVVCARQVPVEKPVCRLPEIMQQASGFYRIQEIHRASMDVLNALASEARCQHCRLGSFGPSCKAMGGQPCLHPEGPTACGVYKELELRGHQLSGPKEQLAIQEAYVKEMALVTGIQGREVDWSRYTNIRRS
jgi:hypothetical protein